MSGLQANHLMATSHCMPPLSLLSRALRHWPVTGASPPRLRHTPARILTSISTTSMKGPALPGHPGPTIPRSNQTSRYMENSCRTTTWGSSRPGCGRSLMGGSGQNQMVGFGWNQMGECGQSLKRESGQSQMGLVTSHAGMGTLPTTRTLLLLTPVLPILTPTWTAPA